MNTYDGMIFDLDGTLWDATKVITKAWNEGYRLLQLPPKSVTRQQIMDCMGLLIPDIAARLYPELDKENQLAVMNKTIEVENQWLCRQGGELYEGLEDTLKQLLKKGYRLFIVSNCQAGYIESFLKAHHMETYFEDFECPGNTGLLKADNIGLVSRRNGLSAPVYVGDTKGDADAAHKAGIPFVFAAYGFGNVKDYEYRVESLSGLTEIF